MSKRELSVIKAFINVVKTGEYTFDYAWIMMNDNERYGYLTDEAKELFYATFKGADLAEAEEVEV